MRRERPIARGMHARGRWLVGSGVVALLGAVALAAVIFESGSKTPFALDLEWMSRVITLRDQFWTSVALAFNFVGGGWFAIVVIPLVIIAGLLLLRRPWAAAYVMVAILATTGLVQLLKQLVGRSRPGDMLITSDFGSFPSGHAANAAVIAMTLGIVFSRGWVWALGSVMTVAMMLSRTYLGAHWLSDTVGGALIGFGVAVIAWSLFQSRLEPPRRAHTAESASG